MKSDKETVELRVLPDGRILAHNLTPEMAELLRAVNPLDEQMERRAKPNELPARN